MSGVLHERGRVRRWLTEKSSCSRIGTSEVILRSVSVFVGSRIGGNQRWSASASRRGTSFCKNQRQENFKTLDLIAEHCRGAARNTQGGQYGRTGSTSVTGSQPDGGQP